MNNVGFTNRDGSPPDFYIMTLVACRMYNQTESLVPGRRVFFVPSRFVCENVESIEINRKQSETVSRQAQADNFHYPLHDRWNQGGIDRCFIEGVFFAFGSKEGVFRRKKSA